MSLTPEARSKAVAVFSAADYLGPSEKLLIVETEAFVASALFQKVDSLWYCLKAGPSLGWMLGKSPEQIKISLVRMKARWEFISSTEPSPAGGDRTTSEAGIVEHEHLPTSADAGPTQSPDGQGKDTGFDTQSYPDLKGVKPLDTAPCAVVTMSPRDGSPVRDSHGSAPHCHAARLEQALE